MKVFVVAWGQESASGEECYVLGVFSTKEKAETAIEGSKDKNWWLIFERDIDVAVPDKVTDR